jgi:hypothetical protein
MTNARRHVRVPTAPLHDALEAYVDRGNRIIYPVGTVIVADHELNGRITERSVMKKRGDGHWDYAVYDSAGVLAPSTTTPPKPLKVPTQCAGCHLGTRLYEPEKSFPAPARPGPAGPRKIHWSRPLPSPDLVGYFDEHRKRSDGILGIYGTLFISELKARQSTDSLNAEDLRLLELLGL